MIMISGTEFDRNTVHSLHMTVPDLCNVMVAATRILIGDKEADVVSIFTNTREESQCTMFENKTVIFADDQRTCQ
jgi:hypothetical protein